MEKKIQPNREKDTKKTLIITLGSTLITLAFSIYNAALGFSNGSAWHICAFFYYLMLLFVKGTLLSGKYIHRLDKKKNAIINISFVLLLLASSAMIGPIVIMIQDKRAYNWGLIPAIVSATYTTYSVTMAILNMSKAKKIDDAIVKQTRLLNLVTALMSVLVLQNTLINAVDGNAQDMKLLTAFTSAGIILAILVIIVFCLIKSKRASRSI